ncbi:hypothetical protein [Candidatus Vidania fulgoroideorum]
MIYKLIKKLKKGKKIEIFYIIRNKNFKKMFKLTGFLKKISKKSIKIFSKIGGDFINLKFNINSPDLIYYKTL